MRTKWVAAFALAGAGASLAGAVPAGAGQAPTAEMVVEPTSGPAGSGVTVSGDGCLPDIETYAWVRFVDFYGTSGVEEVTILDEAEVEPNAEGEWSTTLTVPDVPAGPYFVFADCMEEIEGESHSLVGYTTVEFEVTEGSEPTTPTTPTTAPPTEPPAPEAPTPPPATPVVRPPDQTG